MRTHFMARFRPADDTAWADPDTGPRLHFSLVTDLRGVRGYDSTAGQRLSRELEIRFSPDPGDGPDPDPDCTDLVDRVGWGIAPATFPHFAFDAAAVRVSAPVLVATYTPPAAGSPASIDVNGRQMVVQFPDGNLAAWLVPELGLYAISARYAPPLEAGERPLVCRPVGPDVSMEVPARLVIVVAGNSEVLAEAVGDGETDAFAVSGSAPDPEPTHSGMTWIGALTFDGAAMELSFFGTVDEQWTLTVTDGAGSGPVVRVSGDQVGAVGDYPLGATISPINAQAEAPYFTMKAEGWPEDGDPAQVGDVLIFTTSAATFLPPDLTCDTSLVLDQTALDRWIAERIGLGLSAFQEYPIYLETARGWGELAWRAVHNCSRAESEWLSGHAVIDNDRGSDGVVWVYGRERVQVGVLSLAKPDMILFKVQRMESGFLAEYGRSFWQDICLNGVSLGGIHMSGEYDYVYFAPEGFDIDPEAHSMTFQPGPVLRYNPEILILGENILSFETFGECPDVPRPPAPSWWENEKSCHPVYMYLYRRIGDAWVFIGVKVWRATTCSTGSGSVTLPIPPSSPSWAPVWTPGGGLLF